MQNRREARITSEQTIDQTLHNDYPITGWPLPILARLDRRGARGLTADLAVAGSLTRQAAYVVAAEVDLDAPEEFLQRLGIDATGAEGIGQALRTRHARDLIAATYGVEPKEVPTGFLRALARIQEVESERSGFDPLDWPHLYERLWEIMTAERAGAKAVALRFCGKLRANSILAVDRLDPVLLHPEIVRTVSTPRQIDRANRLVALLRVSIKNITDEELARILRQSTATGGPLEGFAKKVIMWADQFPAPPIPACKNLRPMTSAAELVSLGKTMGNCAATKVAEALLGLSAIYQITHESDDGTVTMLAVELVPLRRGWMVAQVKLAENRKPPRDVLRATLDRLENAGIMVPGPAPLSDYNDDLANVLGVYRYEPLDDALCDGHDDERDAVRDLEFDLSAAA
ncbi:hypothetical protein FV219_00855 [Methylobacterium sp. WL122]|nr:hypothetical protein FV219_00855 [Methylobacterium sp. WL122]